MAKSALCAQIVMISTLGSASHVDKSLTPVTIKRRESKEEEKGIYEHLLFSVRTEQVLVHAS